MGVTTLTQSVAGKAQDVFYLIATKHLKTQFRLSGRWSDHLIGKFKLLENQSIGNGWCELIEPN